MEKPIPGLYPKMLNGKFYSKPLQYGIGGEADSFYEYLLKMYVSTKDKRFKEMYDVAARAIRDQLIFKTEKYTFPSSKNQGEMLQENFEHLTCFVGGMFALGAEKKNVRDTFFSLGAQITDTCRESYLQSKYGLGNEITLLRQGQLEGLSVDVILRPEYVESLFYLWRYTHDQKYRDWGWEVVQNLEKHSKTKYAYQSLHGYEGPVDRMESFYPAETLKYLYLLFSDDDVLSLDEFVINTEAQPFSIRGFGARSDAAAWVKIPPFK